MKYTKVSAGKYKADNGYVIKSNAGINIWTGRMMKTTFWYVLDEQGNDTYLGGCTLNEAKRNIEKALANK